MPHYARFIGIGLGIAMLAVWAGAGDNLLPAPPNCSTARIGKTEYVKGEVYISGHQDTVMLKEFGFRNLEFVGRSFRAVKYFALWPVDLDVKALPEEVTGLNYDRPPDEMVLAKMEKAEADPQVRAFLKEIPEAWSCWPNVSDIRGSGVNNGGWYGGGRYSSGWGSYSGGRRSSGTVVYGPRGRSYTGGCSKGKCSYGGATRLRPDDFGILQGYKRAGDGQMRAR